MVELAIGATTEIYFSVVGVTVVCEKRFVCVHEIKIGHVKFKLWFSFVISFFNSPNTLSDAACFILPKQLSGSPFNAKD